jgi:uncharacterized membrane protein
METGGWLSRARGLATEARPVHSSTAGETHAQPVPALLARPRVRIRIRRGCGDTSTPMNRLRALWRNLDASLWFVPAVMVAVSIALAFGLVVLDVRIGHAWVGDGALLVGAGADGARGMLATIAASMMTVAALTFSLTLSTLAQVSSQYTSRVLRNFMRNRTNQLVLGFFVSIFVYCLVVLRTVRSGEDGSFVPAIAVTMGLALALMSIGVLVFFIHHIASSIQAANIVAQVAEEADEAILRLYPDALADLADTGDAEDTTEPLVDVEDRASRLRWMPIAANETGYVQDIDGDTLRRVARRLGASVRVERGIGSFVARGAELVSVATQACSAGDVGSEREPPREKVLDEATLDEIHGAFSVGHQRTIEQDVGFGLRQIVDIALKALSPGVNDVTTAIMCVDHLGALLATLSTRCLVDPLGADAETVASDDDGTSRTTPPVRVFAAPPTFDSFLATAIDQIRVAGEGNLAILLRLLNALETTAARLDTPARAQSVREHVRRIEETAARTLPTEEARAEVRERAERVERRLRGSRDRVVRAGVDRSDDPRGGRHRDEQDRKHPRIRLAGGR